MGLFITFEGIDGCGKSTQIKEIYKKLQNLKYNVILTREPGGTCISEKIRDLILSIENSKMTSKCELFLYLAARAQHVEEKIIPELEKNNIVLSDRFEEATFAYQGAGRGFDTYTIRSINSYATSNLMPDLTFIFDISPEESEKRAITSGKIKDRMELNDKEFFKKIRNSYRFQSELSPERIFLIDGAQSIKDITDEVFCRILSTLLRKNIEPV